MHSPTAAPAAAPPRPRALVADDEADIRELLTLLLEAEGYEVVAVGDGQAAVEMALQHTFEIAVLDIQMPRLDGIGAAARLRAEWPHLRIAFHTAMDLGWVRARSRDFDAFWLKPLTLEGLERGIRELAG